MTIARDIHTGQVVGQVTAVRRPSIPQMLGLENAPEGITILTREGYLTVPATSVRVEEVR
jgi:hypothetical protein